MTRNLIYGLAGAAGLLFFGLFGLLVLLGGGISSTGTSTCGEPAGTAGEPPLTVYYQAAASHFKLGPGGYAYLAAINDIETRFGTNLAVSSAGAVGWMQFEPATFAQYAVSVTDPTQPADPDDPQDAIYTAAHMLNADGAPADWSGAIYAYNHADWYVTEIEQTAATFIGATGRETLADAINQAWAGTAASGAAASVDVADTAGQSQAGCAGVELVADTVTPVPGNVAVIMPSGLARPPQDAPQVVQDMIEAGDRITGFDYQWGGGHADPALSDSQTDPDPRGGTEPGVNGTPGYDCSGATDYVLWGGGYGPTLLNGSDPASGPLETVGQPGPGRWVTWYAQAGHVFIEVAGIVLDTVHGYPVAPASPSSGPRWQPAGEIDYELTYDGAFVARHLEGL